MFLWVDAYKATLVVIGVACLFNGFTYFYLVVFKFDVFARFFENSKATNSKGWLAETFWGRFLVLTMMSAMVTFPSKQIGNGDLGKQDF